MKLRPVPHTLKFARLQAIEAQKVAQEKQIKEQSETAAREHFARLERRSQAWRA